MFVVSYAGEVITSEEAERRGKAYDAVGRTYLFDLDFNLGDDNPYTVSIVVSSIVEVCVIDDILGIS